MGQHRSTTTSKVALAGALSLSVLTLLLAGCAGTTPPQGPQPTDTAASQSADPGVTQDGDVTAISIKFMPMTITVPVGTTVKWVNGEAITHTITSGAYTDVNPSTGLRGSETPDGLFNVTLNPQGEDGDTFEYTFTKAGTYPYYCDIHLTMNATVIVQ